MLTGVILVKENSMVGSHIHDVQHLKKSVVAISAIIFI